MNTITLVSTLKQILIYMHCFFLVKYYLKHTLQSNNYGLVLAIAQAIYRRTG